MWIRKLSAEDPIQMSNTVYSHRWYDSNCHRDYKFLSYPVYIDQWILYAWEHIRHIFWRYCQDNLVHIFFFFSLFIFISLALHSFSFFQWYWMEELHSLVSIEMNRAYSRFEGSELWFLNYKVQWIVKSELYGRVKIKIIQADCVVLYFVVLAV